MAVRGCFVTGTDTGAGKTILAAALCAAIRASGERVAAFKPVVTGIDEPAGEWPADHELLAAVTGARPRRRHHADLRPRRLPAPRGRARRHDDLARRARLRGGEQRRAMRTSSSSRASAGCSFRSSDEHDIRDLAVALGLPLVIAARPGLGTINHSLLTIEAARAAGLDVRAVVLTPWPDEPSVMERSNRATIASRGARRGLHAAPRAATSTTSPRAGASLPWPHWLGGGSI